MVQRFQPGLGTSVKWEESVDRKQILYRTPNVFKIPGEDKNEISSIVKITEVCFPESKRLNLRLKKAKTIDNE